MTSAGYWGSIRNSTALGAGKDSLRQEDLAVQGIRIQEVKGFGRVVSGDLVTP